MKMLFVATLIRNKLCIIDAFFDYFFHKSFFTENYFLIAAINLTTWRPLYTCLVFLIFGTRAVHNNITKLTMPYFFKKPLFLRENDKVPIFEGLIFGSKNCSNFCIYAELSATYRLTKTSCSRIFWPVYQ